MKDIGSKLLKLGALFGVGIVALELIGPTLGERMDRMFQEAPDDFPPKWMYTNITAIRENTDRILEALAKDSDRVEGEVG